MLLSLLSWAPLAPLTAMQHSSYVAITFVLGAAGSLNCNVVFFLCCYHFCLGRRWLPYLQCCILLMLLSLLSWAPLAPLTAMQHSSYVVITFVLGAAGFLNCN